MRGVVGRWNDINAALTDYSQGWTLERMPAVDRAILRLGAWEVLWNDEIPDAVAISEAVALATDLSTDESPAFVNGLLGAPRRGQGDHRLRHGLPACADACRGRLVGPR